MKQEKQKTNMTKKHGVNNYRTLQALGIVTRVHVGKVIQKNEDLSIFLKMNDSDYLLLSEIISRTFRNGTLICIKHMLRNVIRVNRYKKLSKVNWTLVIKALKLRGYHASIQMYRQYQQPFLVVDVDDPREAYINTKASCICSNAINDAAGIAKILDISESDDSDGDDGEGDSRTSDEETVIVDSDEEPTN